MQGQDNFLGVQE